MYRRGLAHNLEPAQPEDGTRLTPRELEVAALVAEAMTDKEIARRLVIAQRTAEGHVGHILAKLGMTSRAQVAAWAAQLLVQQSVGMASHS